MITRLEAEEMQRRCETARNRRTVAETTVSAKELLDQACEREVGRNSLHEEIQSWCDRKFPKWVTVHSRTDRPSTTATGTADFVVFGPYPICLVVEAKSRTGKPTTAQLLFKQRMEALGWTVDYVRSKRQFIELTTKAIVEMASLADLC